MAYSGAIYPLQDIVRKMRQSKNIKLEDLQKYKSLFSRRCENKVFNKNRDVFHIFRFKIRFKCVS